MNKTTSQLSAAELHAIRNNSLNPVLAFAAERELLSRHCIHPCEANLRNPLDFLTCEELRAAGRSEGEECEMEAHASLHEEASRHHQNYNNPAGRNAKSFYMPFHRLLFNALRLAA